MHLLYVIKMEFDEIKHLTNTDTNAAGSLRVVITNNHKQKSNRQIREEFELLKWGFRISVAAVSVAALAAIGSIASAYVSYLSIQQRETETAPAERIEQQSVTLRELNK